MKIEELEPYLKSLRDWLLLKNFNKNNKISILESYEKEYGSYGLLIIEITFGNQYIYVKDLDDNEIVTIYNSDKNGNLTIEYLELLIKTIY